MKRTLSKRANNLIKINRKKNMLNIIHTYFIIKIIRPSIKMGGKKGIILNNRHSKGFS